MAISDMLEDFSHQSHRQGSYLVSEDALEETRLASFENGYQAGWEDASAAHAAEQSHISAEFSQNLQALNFTYHEAYNHVMTTLEPLLTQMVDTVLPDLANRTLGSRIVSEAIRMAREHAEPELKLTLSPASRSRLEPQLLADLPLPVGLVEDESLGEGQVFLKMGNSERRIDLDGLQVGMRAVITGFFNETKREAVDG